MIFYLEGTPAHQFEDSIVLDVNGVGYQVFMPALEVASLDQADAKVKLFIYHVIREDSQNLYGFSSLESRAFFIQLTSVSGVGPKVALKLLSSVPAPLMIKAILQEDLAVLTSVSGVGRKLAERLILDLRDKLPKLSQIDHAKSASSALTNNTVSDLEKDLTLALRSLGYSNDEIKHALRQCAHLLTPESTEQEGLKILLRHL